MIATDVAAREPDAQMAQVAALLDRAAQLAWKHAEAAGAESPLHDLGLGVYLARGAAAQLLTANGVADEPEEIDERGVLELLADAESLIGTRTNFIYGGLAVALGDLIREAQALGC